MKESISKSLSLAHHSLAVNPGRSNSMWLVTKSDIVSPGVSPLMLLAEMKPSSRFIYKIKGEPSPNLTYVPHEVNSL